jgi:hypothetical protein
MDDQVKTFHDLRKRAALTGFVAPSFNFRQEANLHRLLAFRENHCFTQPDQN